MNEARKIRRLAAAECCNYDCGMCIPQDRSCHVINVLWPEKDHRPVACKWFLTAVLPLEPGLECLVRRQQEQADQTTSAGYIQCAACGAEFIPVSNRQRFCKACGKENEKQKGRARRRKAYAKAREGL